MRTVDPFPYAGLPARQNWRSAVSAVHDRRTIDPQGAVKFTLARSVKIASAGSCFAQRLAVRLQDLGLNYIVAERGGEPYSARYGDVYTSRQLVQLLERALGRFDPLERAWTAPGGFIDPFRPGAAGTFASVAELETDRRAHLAAVRELFAKIDVFLFTLGLTELWFDRRDDAVFPACPGRGRGVFDAERHVWRNLDVETVTADLDHFIAILREVNPAAKLILTVSPVPTAATMMPLHVVRASLRSKSVLKVAAEDVAARYDHVDYFASYDVFTQNLGGERMFGGDGRQPLDEIAHRVVSFFVRDYFGENGVSAPARVTAPPAAAGNGRPCDEDVLLDLIAADDARRRSETSTAFAHGTRNGHAEQIAHPVPLYFAGDSNVLIFRDRVFSVPNSSTPYLGRTLFTPGLSAFDVCDGDGRLNQNLLASLVGENLLMADHSGGWTAYARVGSVPLDFVQDIEGRVRSHPPILLFCGVFDWVLFLEEIGGREIALPPELASEGAASAADVMEFDAAVTIASRYLAPLERGLRVLRSYGLRNLCLHSLQPPTTDDELFARLFFACSATARYGAMRLMNHLLRGICERTGTAYVDIWPLVTGPRGVIDSKYAFDAVHLNLDAALVTVDVLLATLQARPPDDVAAAEPPAPRAQEMKEPESMIDDIANPAELRLGAGWQPVERDNGDLFRWAGDDAILYVPVFAPVDHRLSIELEPGPGVGSKPFSVEIYDATGALVGAFVVRGRQTVEVTLRASLPAMHSLRLHVVDGGRHFAGDDRVLDYRAFRVAVTPQRVDVVPSISGFRVGAGWYQLEEFGGSTFRWVSNDATVEVSSHATELALEVEPGPGVGKQPFTLAAIGPRGEELASFAVSARERIVIPLRPDEAPPYVITLRAQGGGRSTIGDSRILNFRAFQSR